MSWLTDWKALYSRIKGLIDAGSFFFRAQHTSSEDYLSVKKTVLLSTAEKIFNDLNEFMANYESILPTAAYDSLNRFLNDERIKGINFKPSGGGQTSGNVQFALTSLVAFGSEFTYLISDTQAIARRVTERAFVHLQRSIIVDDEVRKKWNVAFNTGERNCERLGAVHLLSHGIWAFKADAKGQTDLVLNEPLPKLSIIESAADALVLTEWKVVKSKKDINVKIQEARKQTENYSSGVLGGVEIANYRYLVMVSEREMDMPDNRLEEEIVTYRHINIPVNPKYPSVEARTKT